MNKRHYASIIGSVLMIIGFVHFMLSQSIDNTRADITYYFAVAFITFLSGYILVDWWGMTDEDFDTLFNRFADWLERPGKYPRLPWGRLVVGMLAAVIPTLWAIYWPVSVGKLIAALLAPCLFGWFSRAFFKAFWHRLGLMDEEELRRKYPGIY
ncbi:MAG: hypothetical protein KIH67_004595 [Candidatus Moranbacteria bacterium]|nr:hypothetical protein [Candidatus Moranbacteria bacterium]